MAGPLETDRLVLRCPERADVPRIRELVSAAEIAATTFIPHPYQEGYAEHFVRRGQEGHAAGDYFSFAVIRRDGNLLVGAIRIRIAQEHRSGELAYWVGVPYWGQGYMTEAARRVIHFGFEECGLQRIHASFFTHNIASRRVMEKSGMRYEGAMRDHIYRDGRYFDLGWCSILREEWLP